MVVNVRSSKPLAFVFISLAASPEPAVEDIALVTTRPDLSILKNIPVVENA